MPFILKFTILSTILIAALVSNSEERKFEVEVPSVADSDLKGDVGAFDGDDHEIEVDDLQSDDHAKHYANETVAVAGHGGITRTRYRSKRMRKSDDDEDITSEYYRRRRPDYDDEDGSIMDDNERWRKPDYDENRRRPNDNRRRRNNMTSGGNCQTCGKMLGGKRGTSGYLERVINGRVVQPVYKYPWIVSLIGANCSGAIISPTYVVTASHCLINTNRTESPQCKRRGALPKNCFKKPNEIKVGLLGRRQEEKQRPVRIAQLIPHDQFQVNKDVLHDIALIKLAAPIQCNQLSSPICLPTTDLQKLGGQLIVAGWGINTIEGQKGSQQLREGTMKQVQPKVCQKMTKGFSNNLTDIVCAIGTESRQSSCTGDSGSSIFAPFGNKFYTVGVTSRGSSGKCETDKPVTYAKIYRYMNWIKRHVRDLPGS